MNHPLAVALLREVIEPLNRSKILSKARRLEFGVSAPQIVTFELRIDLDPAGQQPAAERAIAEGRDLL